MKSGTWGKSLFLGVFCLVATAVQPVQAGIHTLPQSLAPAILSETVPFVFTPADFTSEDYQVEWHGRAIPGVEFSLGQNSLEWVRAAEVIVLPRARLILKAKNVNSGRLYNNGFHQPLQMTADGTGYAELPVAMISGNKNLIEVKVKRKGRTLTGKLAIRFKPRVQNQRKVIVDTTCSNHNVEVEKMNIPKDSWVYLGCRFAYVEGSEHRTSSMELYVYWDNIGQMAEIGGVETAASSVSLWPLRLRARPGKAKIKKGQYFVETSYRVPERLHKSFIGAGLGPYAYGFTGGGEGVSTYVPLLTLYGSYYVNNLLRFVMFNATAFHSRFFTDIGVYFLLEQARALDQRFSMRLLLGGHFIGFPANGETHFKGSAPQGFEMTFYDFLFKRWNIGAGAFLYPPISDNAYYNIWIRYGTGGMFVEFNFISWQETVNSEPIKARSAGISFGMPLISFL